MVNNIDPDLLAMMTQTIVVENPVASPDAPMSSLPVLDGYGRHSSTADGSSSGSMVEWGAPVTYQCRLEYSTMVIGTIDGRDQVSSGRAYLAGFFPDISTEARVTVPLTQSEGTVHPLLMKVENNYDETGTTGFNTIWHFE